VQTHVISSIIHVAHEYDDEADPWPVQIEDHDGNLHSVDLAAGQVLPHAICNISILSVLRMKMLFYESAKCLHGRMTTFHGKYYASIFVHYKPEDTSIWNYTIEVSTIPSRIRFIDNVTSLKGYNCKRSAALERRHGL
jgi:hypothetical protein